MGRTQGGPERGRREPTSGGATRPIGLARVVDRAKGWLRSIAQWLGRSDGGPESDASGDRSDEARAVGLRRGPVASLAGAGPPAERQVSSGPSAQPALPERPALVADERTDRLRVADPTNEDAYLESDRWVRVRD